MGQRKTVFTFPDMLQEDHKPGFGLVLECAASLPDEA
jgi:hypothetical protein